MPVAATTTPLCNEYEEEVSSQFGSNSFSVQVIDEENSVVRDGDATLLGSGSSELLVCREYVYISDFMRDDDSAGSVDIVSLSVSVSKPITVTFYLVNSINNELFPDGVCMIPILIVQHFGLS